MGFNRNFTREINTIPVQQENLNSFLNSGSKKEIQFLANFVSFFYKIVFGKLRTLSLYQKCFFGFTKSITIVQRNS